MIKSKKEFYEYKLNKDFSALIEIEHGGQEKPFVSDEVVVLVVIYLPTDEDHIELNKELQFERRLSVCDESLNHQWGSYIKLEGYSPYRRRLNSFSSHKWSKAENKALSWARKELNKLRVMLKNREKALKDAEKD